MARRAVVRATSKVVTRSDSVGMRVFTGKSPRSIRRRSAAAICMYGAVGPVGSICSPGSIFTPRSYLSRHNVLRIYTSRYELAILVQ